MCPHVTCQSFQITVLCIVQLLEKELECVTSQLAEKNSEFDQLKVEHGAMTDEHELIKKQLATQEVIKIEFNEYKFFYVKFGVLCSLYTRHLSIMT